MWAKFSQALKSRSDTDPSVSHTSSDVLTKVYEQHPNLSIFHTAGEIPFPSPDPPDSPSKRGKLPMFKRIPKMSTIKTDDDEPLGVSPPTRLSFGIQRKVKLSGNVHSNGSQFFSADPSSDSTHPNGGSPRHPEDPSRHLNRILHRASQDLLQRPSRDLPPKDPSRHIGETSNLPHTTAPSTPCDIPQSPSAAHTPATPFDVKYGSKRSILRDPNTPGTGQNVRFFSRDAYKVISPDVSMATDASMGEYRAEERDPAKPTNSTPSTRTRSVAEVFSQPDPVDGTEKPDARSSTPFGPPVRASDISDFFDISQDHELPVIPFGLEVPLLDTAIELSSGDEGSFAADRVAAAPPTNMSSTPFRSEFSLPTATDPPSLECSQSFDFGQTVFHSMANVFPTDSNGCTQSSTPPASKRFKVTRSSPTPENQAEGKSCDHALSDTIFHSTIGEPSESSPPRPEEDINNISSASLAVCASSTPEPDPFRANATTYYTPQAMIPTTPKGQRNHFKTTSQEENIIFTLRTQLALQSELCTQYEVDLRARDELVDVLGRRVETAEREGSKRRNILKEWKKKVAELERACRRLEEEVDQSRLESMERSIMDEASGEALRMLHRQISGLEREKAEVERREEALRSEVGTLEGLLKDRTEDVQRLNEALWKRDENESASKNGIGCVKEQIEMGLVAGDGGGVRSSVSGIELEATSGTGVQDPNVYWQLKSREDELQMLKGELEAQWKYTETANEKIQRLEEERGALLQERQSLEANQKALDHRIGDLEAEWTGNENRRNELEGEVRNLWVLKESLEKENDQLEKQLKGERERLENLQHAVQEREDRAELLDQERQFAVDQASRFEENIRQRDGELAEYIQEVARRESDAEHLRERMSTMKREQARVADERNRALKEAIEQEEEAKRQLEDLIRAKAEIDVDNTTLKERVGAFREEVERLRRQIQTLQQESADKEMKIVQLAKQRGQDKEDLHSLNIALDSKQQELELIKRRVGLKGSASTPAPPSRTLHHREGSVTATPIGPLRPPSLTSDAASKDLKSSEALSVPGKVSALSKGTRANTAGNGSSVGSMGPPAFMKPRVSFNTPSRTTGTGTASSRSSSVRAKHTSPPISHQRVPSSSLEQRMRVSQRESQDSGLSETDEKENVDMNGKTPKGRSRIPVLS